MPKLVIDTSAQVHEPIELVVDGKAFTLARVMQPEIQLLEDMKADAQAGNLAVLYKRLDALFGVEGAFGRLSLDELRKVLEFIVDAVVSPEPAEKNGPKPGGETLPS